MKQTRKQAIPARRFEMKNVFGLCALSLLLVACPAPEDTHDHNGHTMIDTGMVMGDTGMTMDTGAVADAGEEPVVDAGPAVTNACTNDSDMAGVQATYADGASAADIASACGMQCFQAMGMALSNECVVDCMRTGTNSDISDACMGCFGGSVVCTVANCALICAADPSSAECAACRCGGNPASVNCVDVYSNCSGIPATGQCP
jgi:hypothetical protein